MNKLLFSLLLCCNFLFIGQISANQGPLKSKLSVQKLITQDGKTDVLAMADKATLGDILEYQLNYSNTGQSSLTGIIVEGPIPSGTTYIANSARTDVKAQLEVTINRGKTWAMPPLFRDIKNADGSMTKMQIPDSEYTAIRWQVISPLEAGKNMDFIYRIKVNE